MWLFTKYGFFSAVCTRIGDGSPWEPVDPERIMIRARVDEDLQRLKTRFEPLLAPCEIRESADSDYRFRIFVAKSGWRQIVAELADETDYDNFKSEVARHQGPSGAAYERSLHEVWSVMHRLQNNL